MPDPNPTVEEISFLDPAIQADPYPAYRTLHKEMPVYQMPETGMYVVTKYADIREVIKNTKVYSNDVVFKKQCPIWPRHSKRNA